MIVKSYARHLSTEAAHRTIINDVRASNERTMDVRTFEDYIEALSDIYIIDDISAWNPNIRKTNTYKAFYRYINCLQGARCIAK